MIGPIFLSASVPDQKRDPRYYDSADVIAIRDATRALATVVLPYSSLVWGGHPAITPMIRIIAESLGVNVQERVTLYQSRYFEEMFPDDNRAFARVVLTPNVDGDRTKSLRAMRHTMLDKKNHHFHAGVFIGGMEGVEDEFAMFSELQPEAIRLPVASTGAAALIIYNRIADKYPSELLNDLGYISLFRRLLKFPF